MKSQNRKFSVYTDFYHGCGIDRKWPLDTCALVHFYKLYQGENSFSLAEAKDSIWVCFDLNGPELFVSLETNNSFQ